MKKFPKEQCLEAAIARMRTQNMTYQEIQTILKVSPKRISRVEKSVKKFNLIPDTLPRGQPTKIQPSVLQEINKSTLLDPMITGH
jgi:transposase